MERWKPNVTVATVLERTNNAGTKEYLLVHELRDGILKYNQPAGHLDEHEGLIDAAVRETREETGWDVEIVDLISIYRYVAKDGTTYIRHAFTAKPIKHHAQQALDDGIVAAVWLSYDDIIAKQSECHSPLVKETIDDYRAGKTYPLSILRDFSANTSTD